MPKHLPIGTLVLFAVGVGVVIVVRLVLTAHETDVPQELVGVMRPFAKTLQPFTLETQHGREFALQDFEGKWSFVFFGYTSCPDICPTTLLTLKAMIRDLRAGNATTSDIQVVFVAVDPQRDAAILVDYLKHFDAEFIGVTGAEQSLRRFAEQFGAMFMREPGEVADEFYLISHTSSLFLIDPRKQLVASFAPPHDAGTIASQYQTIRGLL